MTTTASLSFILSEIGSAMDALVELGLKKTDALSSRDISGLEALIPREQDLVRYLAALEVEREKHPEESGPEIERHRLSLKDKAQRIVKTNERNRELLRRGLDLVQYELKLFFQEGKPLVFDYRI